MSLFDNSLFSSTFLNSCLHGFQITSGISTRDYVVWDQHLYCLLGHDTLYKYWPARFAASRGLLSKDKAGPGPPRRAVSPNLRNCLSPSPLQEHRCRGPCLTLPRVHKSLDYPLLSASGARALRLASTG